MNLPLISGERFDVLKWLWVRLHKSEPISTPGRCDICGSDDSGFPLLEDAG